MLARLPSNARFSGMCEVHFRLMKSKVYRLRSPIGLPIADHQKPIDCNCRETEIDIERCFSAMKPSRVIVPPNWTVLS